MDQGHDLTGDGVKIGDGIVLFQDDDDFEVEAIIGYDFVEILRRHAWVAAPDWATKRPIRLPTQVLRG